MTLEEMKELCAEAPSLRRGTFRDEKFIAAARTLLPKLIAVAEAAKRVSDCACEMMPEHAYALSKYLEDLYDHLAALEADT